MLQCEEKVFDVADLQFFAKYWRSDQNKAPVNQASQTLAPRKRVIALHGWLDNCATFDFLAPHLNADVLCIDLAGHGRSGFRQHLGAYNIWLDVPEILAIADQMGWSSFDVLAHSRGACIGYLMASCFPSRVDHLFALDGLFPLMATEDKAREQMIHAMCSVKKQLAKKPTIYSTQEAAIKARQNSMFKITYDEAEALANRSLQALSDGFAWRYDPKVNAPSEMRMTPEQVINFGEGITSPVDIFMATEGLLMANEEMQALLSKFPQWRRHVLSGSHHFHMAEQGQAIAARVNQCWASAS